ncbi:MAG: ferritin family protein [Firmicutes bacterium]|nr:ferritin family protein [Bacillota bacterium]
MSRIVMTEKELSLLQKQAIKFEKHGSIMYLEFAEQTANPLVRRLFYQLALEEIQHIQVIEDKTEGIGEISVDVSHVEQNIKDAFSRLTKDGVKSDADNVEGLEKAMQLEREGIQLYEGLRDNAKTEAEKKFFQFLVDQEAKHLAALQNVYHYLTNNSDWFHGSETEVWNWLV